MRKATKIDQSWAKPPGTVIHAVRKSDGRKVVIWHEDRHEVALGYNCDGTLFSGYLSLFIFPNGEHAPFISVTDESIVPADATNVDIGFTRWIEDNANLERIGFEYVDQDD
jgi:hypothetical protein